MFNLKLITAVLLSTLVLLLSHSAQAQITVSCSVTELVAAIDTANTTPEADTLNLSSGCFYIFTESNNTDGAKGDSGLPIITTPIIINGNGAVFQRGIGAPEFRYFSMQNTGSLTLSDLSLTGGKTTAEGHGGAIFNQGTLTLTNVTISGSSAVSHPDSRGGGIRNDGGVVTITNSIILGNTASSDGGISNSGTLTISNSSVSGNTAVEASGSGGGIRSFASTLTIINSTISNNLSTTEGGGINVNGGTAAFVNSTISGNTSGRGAGIATTEATVTLINSVISGNAADLVEGRGGALHIIGSSANTSIINSTIAGNNAFQGGAIYDNVGTLSVTNSIIWGNSSAIREGITFAITYSLIQGGRAGTGNLDANPLFVSAEDFTSAPTDNGDYRLQSASPAINQANTAALPIDTYDLDGDDDVTEALSYDGDNTDRIKYAALDMGAFEYGTFTELLTNGGFENHVTRPSQPDQWNGKRLTKDRLKCDTDTTEFSRTGSCAFRFVGGKGEKALLAQGNPAVSFLTTGMNLNASVYYKTKGAAPRLKVALKVFYEGVALPVVTKTILTTASSSQYTLFSLTPYTIESGVVSKVRLQFLNRAPAGKIYLDDVSLIADIPPVSPAASGLGSIPLPAAAQ